jgi:twin BRCT domain
MLQIDLHTYVGQKYDYAVKWNINIVSVEWLHQSVEAGYSLDEAQFPVTDDRVQNGIRLTSATTSTPTNHTDGRCNEVNGRIIVTVK